jgi:hypothetical protein
MIKLGGDANNANAPVHLSDDARKQGTYVIGTTGTGKTTVLLNMILQDIARRHPYGYDGICVLDPHGDFTGDLLERIPDERVGDVILFDPTDAAHPYGLNLFDLQNKNDPRERDRVVSTVIDTLYKLFASSWGPRMEDLLRHAIHSLLLHSEPTTMLDLMLLLVSQEHRQRLTQEAKAADPILRAYWRDQFPEGKEWEGMTDDQRDLVSSSLNKIGRFLVNPILRNIICQEHSTVNFRQAMDEGKIVLVNLSKGDLGPDNAALLGSVLVNQIFIAALSRRELPQEERRPFHLYVDEYQSFATKTFPELQSEARKYGIDTVVAHQYRDQLDEDNRGSTLNVANLIVLRVSGMDAGQLAAQFNLAPPEPERRFEPVRYLVDETQGLWAEENSLGSGQKMYQEVEGARQLYSDVQLEVANILAQLPNHQALCRVLEGRNLKEYRINLERKPDAVGGVQKAANISLAAQARATPIQEVEDYIARRTASQTGAQTPGSYATQKAYRVVERDENE